MSVILYWNKINISYAKILKAHFASDVEIDKGWGKQIKFRIYVRY